MAALEAEARVREERLEVAAQVGSYLRLIDFVYHSTLGLRVTKKKRRLPRSERSTLNAPSHPSTLDPRPSTLNPQPSTLDPRPSTLTPRPSTLNPTPGHPNLEP